MLGLLKAGVLKSYTVALIIVNLVIFILTSIFGAIFGQVFLEYLAIKPAALFAGQHVWSVFTSMFVHAGFAHLFANMLSLFFIGLFLERIIGKKRFLWLYIISGLFAGVFYAGLSVLFGNSDIGARIFGDPNILALGASGAIFGLLGLLAVLTPRNRVYLIAGPLIAIIIQAVLTQIIPNKTVLGILDFAITIYFIFSIFAIISFSSRLRRFAIPVEMPFWILPIVAIVPLIIIGLFVQLPIGNMGHLGGLIVGLLYGFYLRSKYPNKTKMIERQFSK